jgi:hypothetical protein
MYLRRKSYAKHDGDPNHAEKSSVRSASDPEGVSTGAAGGKTLVGVIGVDIIMATNRRSFCCAASSIVPISQADDYLKKTEVSQIRLDSRLVPLPEPVDWERYDRELSVIAMTQSQPSGLLLVSRDGEDFVLNFAWSRDNRSILAMLSYALSVAEKTASPDAQLLIAAISESAEKLVRAIFSSAQPMKTTQAKLSFYSA